MARLTKLDNAVHAASSDFVRTYAHTDYSMWSHVGEDSLYELIIDLSALAEACIE